MSTKYLLCAGLGLMAALLLFAGCATTETPAPEPEKKVVLPIKGEWVETQAIWYGQMYHGRRTTSGEEFDMRKLTAAHPTLPLGAKVELMEPASGKTVLVRINDRSHLAEGQDLAISKAAVQALGLFPRRHFTLRYRWLE